MKGYELIANNEQLRAFYPLDSLDEDDLELLRDNLTLESVAKGRVIVEYGSSDELAIYLISGKLSVTAVDGRTHIIEDGSTESFRPISHLDPHRYTIRALTHVEIFRINNTLINNIVQHALSQDTETASINVSRHLANNQLFQALYNDLENNKLIIPTLPKVAIQIKQLIDSEVDVKQIERIVETDPSLTAKLLKAANSPLFRTKAPVNSIKHVIQLLGLRTIKNLVFTYAVRDLFRSDHVILQKRLGEVWTHSAEVASVSYVLAQRLGTFDPDHAMLLGLLHDIGMLPIISYLENFPDLMKSPQLIDDTITQLHGEIGAAIMEKWHFGADYVAVAAGADDWYRNQQDKADYCDLVIIAQLHAFIGKQTDDIQKLVGGGKLPNLVELPAFKKLCLSWDDPGQSISMLADAQKQLTATKNLLSL